jgi:hypothetical protein
MYFSEQRPRDERDEERLRVLHLSLNTPIVAIDEFPVGPARAGIALCEDPEGAIRLEIAVRSLRTGQMIFYAPDEEFDGERNAVVAIDAALSFAEGMGFLFDEDEIAARGDDGRREAAARWRNLVENVSELAAEPAASEPPRSRAEATAPVLELVCEVPVQDGESGVERIDVRDGDEVVLSDVAVPAEAAVAAAAAPERALSKFRLAVGAVEPQRDEEGIVAPDGEGAVAVSVAPPDSRIRLLSRF